MVDSRCSQHISSNRKMFSSYTSVQRGEVLIENSVTSKVLAKEQSSFGLIIDVSLLFKAFVIFPNQGTISSLLEPYKRKGSVSVRKVILWKFPKRLMWCFKPTCQQCVYVAKFRSYSWWIAVILGFGSGGCENNQKLLWFQARMFSFTPKRDWD